MSYTSHRSHQSNVNESSSILNTHQSRDKSSQLSRSFEGKTIGDDVDREINRSDESAWRDRFKQILALVCLAIMIATWIAMAELLQAMQQKTSKVSYSKPFFMVYIVHGIGYTIFLISWLLYMGLRWVLGKIREKSNYTYLNEDAKQSLDLATLKRMVISGILLNPIMFICGWLWYISLPLTNVAANTGIYNSASVFVFVFSIVLLGEKPTIIKFASLFVSLIGVIVVTVVQITDKSANDAGQENTIGGYLLVIGSTILYAIYEVLYTRYAVGGHGEHQSSTASSWQTTLNACLFIGTSGFASLLMFWPGILILNAIKFEVFEFPPAEIIEFLTINTILDCIFNLLLLIGIALTSPLFMSIGSVLTIPASILTELFLRGHKSPGLSYLGICLIFVGFIGLNLGPYLMKKYKTKELVTSKTKSINYGTLG